MHTVAFVPIKLNNERLPGKNTKPFGNGRPLFSHILNTLKQIEAIDSVYVYCSDSLIMNYLDDEEKKGIHFQKRAPYLDLSTTSFNKVLTSFADDVTADIYVLAHATAPFISQKSFKAAIDAVSSGAYDSAFSVIKLQEFLWSNGLPNYNVSRIPRTQDIDPVYMETCGMYVYNSELISKERRRIGNHPFLVEVSKIEACDINNYDDFLVADLIAHSRFLKQ